MKKLALLLAAIALTGAPALCQEAMIAPPEGIVADGVPKIPASLAETAGRYSENRAAFVTDWHPQRREMLIGTRFGNTYQAHLLKMPGGARTQLTFFADPVYGGSFHPTTGDYMVIQKDVGGGEWYQLYRYDLATGDSTLLTDGKSRNLRGPWATKGDRLAYTSTRRTGQDNDLWVIDPSSPNPIASSPSLQAEDGSPRTGLPMILKSWSTKASPSTKHIYG